MAVLVKSYSFHCRRERAAARSASVLDWLIVESLLGFDNRGQENEEGTMAEGTPSKTQVQLVLSTHDPGSRKHAERH